MYTRKFDRQEILGILKQSGSRDRDVLYTAKNSLIKFVETMKFGAMMMKLVGVLFSLTLVGAVIGIPLFLYGIKVKKKALENLTTIETTYAEYVSSL